MKPDYKRLLDAAKSLKGWDGPSQIAFNLTLNGYRVTEQMMTNWKTRGLSTIACLKAAAIIGCTPEWLESGDGEMSSGIHPKDDLDALLALATPRSASALKEIAKAAKAGKLTDDDLALLQTIATRFQRR